MYFLKGLRIICIIIVWYLVFSGYLFAQDEDKFIKFMPPNTELVERNFSGSSQSPSLILYRFKTGSSKETILKFYRLFFTNEGFKEYSDYSISLKDNKPYEYYYIFNKPGYLIVFNIEPPDREEEYEENILYYNIALHRINQ